MQLEHVDGAHSRMMIQVITDNSYRLQFPDPIVQERQIVQAFCHAQCFYRSLSLKTTIEFDIRTLPWREMPHTVNDNNLNS